MLSMSQNPYISEFHERLRERFADDTSAMSYSTWMMKNTTLNRKPFGFKGYEFQIQIANDMHPDLWIIKPSQVGASEFSFRKTAAFVARNPGTSVIFTLPDEAMFKRLSNTRFGPMLENDRVFNPITASRPIRRTDLYQIGMSYVYFVGGVEGAATSIPADMLVHDELDLSDQELIALFQSRLQGSEHRITHRLSTPTFTGFGIHAGYLTSNQTEYLTKCPSCNHWNLPKWSPEHIHFQGLSSDISDLFDITSEMAEKIDFSQSYVFCTNCGTALDLVDPDLREWVSRYPSRSAHGYAITPFATPRLTIDYILKQQFQYQRAGAIRRFHNTVLGEAYDDANARLSELEIRAVMDGSSSPEVNAPHVIGIDVGTTCTVTLLALTDPLLVTKVAYVPRHSLVDFVTETLSTYNVVGGCIDRYPETELSNEIRDLSHNLILPCEYSTTMNLVKDEFGNVSHVRGDRTEMLDTVATDVRKKRLRIQGYGHHEALIVQQLRSQVRVEKPDTKAVWQKTDGNDHYHHALGYARFAIRVHNLTVFKNSTETRTAFGMEAIPMRNQIPSQLGMIRRG